MLDSQIQIYAADTGDFYSNHEAYLHKLNHQIRMERNQLLKGGVFKNSHSSGKRSYVGLKNLEKHLFSIGVSRKTLDKLCDLTTDVINEYDFSNFKSNQSEIKDLVLQCCRFKHILKIKTKKIKAIKDELLKLLSHKADQNIATHGRDHIRQLNDAHAKVVSFFESAFTRMIKAKPNELTDAFMVVQIYYFDILRDILHCGYEYHGERYRYFTSSAGQIRTKKAVFIKESLWNQYEKTIMCGLTIDEINRQGGCNSNKYLSYMALINSATDEWKEFDIDKTIVINDFETNVYGTFDFIDDKDFSITRKNDYIPITHTDGAGMILPYAFGVKQCNKMIRIPWVKGLISPFDFKKFIEKNKASLTIKDIYGIEHDVIAEDIQIIFTKSQFKLH